MLAVMLQSPVNSRRKGTVILCNSVSLNSQFLSLVEEAIVVKWKEWVNHSKLDGYCLTIALT